MKKFPLKINVLMGALIISFTLSGCTKQDGSVSGTVTPPAHGIRIAAVQNGKIISSAEAAAQDGKFSLALAPGTYDISVSAPASPLPVIFHGVVVQQGIVRDLSHIDISNGAEKGILSGRVTPASAGTVVALLIEGKERASVNTDSQGNYLFTQLPVGSYTVRAIAPAYGPEALPVIVSADGTTTRNFTLFYTSPIEGVDWSSGKIRVNGIGIPPRDAANPTIRRELARRAALADARRKLVKAIAEIKVGPDQSLNSRMGEKKFSRAIEGFIKGYTVVGERELDGGKVEIDLELPLTGQDGLSRYLVD